MRAPPMPAAPGLRRPGLSVKSAVQIALTADRRAGSWCNFSLLGLGNLVKLPMKGIFLDEHSQAVKARQQADQRTGRRDAPRALDVDRSCLAGPLDSRSSPRAGQPGRRRGCGIAGAPQRWPCPCDRTSPGGQPGSVGRRWLDERRLYLQSPLDVLTGGRPRTGPRLPGRLRPRSAGWIWLGYWFE